MSMIGLGVGLWRSGRGYDPGALFAGGADGIWIDPSDLGSMWQDGGGTVPAAEGAPVGRIDDKSGRGHHATQGLAGARPILRRDAGGRLHLAFDGIDDFLHHGFSVADGDVTLSAAAERNGGAALQGLVTATPPIARLRAGIWASAVAPDWGSYADDAWRSAGHDASARAVLSVVGTASPDRQRLVTNGGGAAEYPNSYAGDGNDRRAIGREYSALSGGQFAGRLYGLVGVARALGQAELAQLAAYQAAKAGIGPW